LRQVERMRGIIAHMGRLIPLLFLIDVVLIATALISCLSAEKSEIRTLPRSAWVLIILAFPLVGAIAWFAAGRPPSAGFSLDAARFASGTPERGRPRTLAPEDDPEFLRSLDLRQAQAMRDRELLSRWEDDLRQPEQEPRRRDPSGKAEQEDDRPGG
jgi:hypothetical protein